MSTSSHASHICLMVVRRYWNQNNAEQLTDRLVVRFFTDFREHQKCVSLSLTLKRYMGRLERRQNWWRTNERKMERTTHVVMNKWMKEWSDGTRSHDGQIKRRMKKWWTNERPIGWQEKSWPMSTHLVMIIWNTHQPGTQRLHSPRFLFSSYGHSRLASLSPSSSQPPPGLSLHSFPRHLNIRFNFDGYSCRTVGEYEPRRSGGLHSFNHREFTASTDF